jgi:hypothetical protein
MKKPLHYFTAFAVFASALVLAACNKSGNSNPPPPVIAPGPGIHDPHSGPIQPGVPFGLYAQNAQMNNYYQNNNTEYIVNNGYRDMMKFAMGVCDRNYSNGGYADCNQWMNGLHDIVIMMSSTQANTARVIFRSMPVMQCQGYNCSWFSYSLPSASNFILNLFGYPTGNFSGVYNPMVLEMTVWPINNNAGFELRGYGPQGSRAWNSLIQVRAETNKLEDPSINFKVLFLGQDAGQGRLGRCVTPSCGLQY